MKLSIIRDGALTVTKMGDGNYESRQRRVSYYNNQKLVIYNDRNGILSLSALFKLHIVCLFCLSIDLSVCLFFCLSVMLVMFVFG